jgi:hypothetical protein
VNTFVKIMLLTVALGATAAWLCWPNESVTPRLGSAGIEPPTSDPNSAHIEASHSFTAPTHSSPALPPLSTPAGATAIALFVEAQKCSRIYKTIKGLEAQLKICESDPPEGGPGKCLLAKQRADADMPELKENLTRCNGVGTKEFEDLRFQAVADAAKIGDTDAQVCFVQSDFNLKDFTKFSQEMSDQYKADARTYIDAAMARGDWRIPSLLARSSQTLSHSRGLLHLITQGDDMTIYRMTRLLRLGATGEYAARLDAKLEEYTEARSHGLRGYPPEQLIAEDEWAKQQYLKSFANSPHLDNDPVICDD